MLIALRMIQLEHYPVQAREFNIARLLPLHTHPIRLNHVQTGSLGAHLSHEPRYPLDHIRTIPPHNGFLMTRCFFFIKALEWVQLHV